MIQCVQWVHSKLVQPSSAISLDGPNGFTWCTEVFPYVVPPDTWLGIADVTFDTKFSDGGPNQRASLLVIPNVLTCPDNAGSRHYRSPIVVPSGTVLTALYYNNDSEAQWMSSTITGLLTPQQPGASYKDAFSFFFGTPA